MRMKGEEDKNTENRMSTIHNGEGSNLNLDDCGPGMGSSKSRQFFADVINR